MSTKSRNDDCLIATEGLAMGKRIRQTFRFQSSSNANKTYETILYVDGTLSCDCPGWTKRAVRTCKHTENVRSRLNGEVLALPVIVPQTAKSKQEDLPVNGRRFNFNL